MDGMGGVQHGVGVPRCPTVSDGVGQAYSTPCEAARAACELAGGLKRMGSALRPELPADEAGRWLAACFSPDKREKMSLAQLGLLRRLLRDAGVHLLAEFEMAAAGYARPVPVRLEDQAAETARMLAQVAQQLEVAMAQLKALGVTVPRVGR